MTLPFPSSPHWPPTTEITAIGVHQRKAEVSGPRRVYQRWSAQPLGPPLAAPRGGSGHHRLALEVVAPIPVSVGAGLDLSPPPVVVDVPAHCRFQRAFKVIRWLPAQPAQLRGVEGIASIMPRPICHESQQIVRLVQQVQNSRPKLDGIDLVPAPYVVHLAWL